jgi:hypothetical protein
MLAIFALLMNCYQVVRKIGLQVEDMLKRSFAEFHAQKKLPEMQQLLKTKLNQPTRVIEYVNYPFLFFNIVVSGLSSHLFIIQSCCHYDVHSYY